MSETNNNTTATQKNNNDDDGVHLKPLHRLHGLNDNLQYPVLIYKTCTDPDAIKPSVDFKHLTVGATWTDWIHEPWYNVRVATFERCLWPYEMPERSLWKSTNGVLLLYTPNLKTLTDLKEPSTVYYKKNNVVRIRIRFIENESIEFTELLL